MEEQPTKSKRGRPPKNPAEYALNPNARNVRAYRARKKEQDDEKYRQDQRTYKEHYNKNWEQIKAEQPVYNDPPYEYRKPKTQQTDYDENSDKNSDTNSDTNSDKDDAVSVKSSEQLDEMINEALEEITEDVLKGKNYEKNKKKRERKKQEKKKNKIPSDEPQD